MKRFTLIELLIVAAIFGILVSLLLPSLNKSRKRARIALCMSNQAQTMRALTSFGVDNNKNLPPALVTGEWRTMKNKYEPMGLGYLVKQELLDPRILYCPTWQHPVARFNVKSPDGKYGGFHTEMQDNPSKFTWVSLAYRLFPDIYSSTNPYRPLSLYKDDSNTAVISDHWTRRGNNDFGWSQGNGAFAHNKGLNYVSAYLTGTVKLKYDRNKTLIAISIKHTDHQKIENAWREHFDLK